VIRLVVVARVLAGLVLVAGLGTAATMGLRPAVAPHALAAAPRRPPPLADRMTIVVAESMIARFVAAAPFRRDRRPPSRSPGPVLASSAAPVPRPELRLTGLALGGRPAAVIDGWPGAEGGRLLVVGDTAAGLRLVRVSADGAVVVGRDTVYRLRLPPFTP
jgi:hypothetical protein